MSWGHCQRSAKFQSVSVVVIQLRASNSAKEDVFNKLIIFGVLRIKAASASLIIAFNLGKVRLSRLASGAGVGIAITPADKQPKKAAITSKPWGYKSKALCPSAR